MCEKHHIETYVDVRVAACLGLLVLFSFKLAAKLFQRLGILRGGW